MLIVLLFLVLVACKDEDTVPTEPIVYEDIIISVVELEETYNTISVSIIIDETLEDEDELYEIVIYVAGHYYEQYLDTIRSKTYTLTVYAYPSLDAFNQASEGYGSMTFDINKDAPGLSISEDALSLGT